MRLQVKPIYGWGWRAPDNRLLETPTEFVLDAHETHEGSIKGHVSSPKHPLDGMWVLMSHRHVKRDGYYNLRAYSKEPASMIEAADIAGYAEAVTVQP
jgi:hypothetical protein